MKFRIIENEKSKSVISPNYNYFFNKETGVFLRWGKTKEEDPLMAPAPEILDLEISSGGDCLGKCDFCYKGNGHGSTHNMTFDEFKNIFDKMPMTLTQIAFGILNISTNPDFFKMMEYAKENGVIPNYTCHGLDVTSEVARKTAKMCGAVAVSVYDKEKSYDAIKMFTDAGMNQVNIHYMLSSESYEKAFEVIDDISTDSRLSKMNAIVFLSLKKKGFATKDTHNYIKSVDQYKKLITYCTEKKVNIGFDSCSAPIYFKAMEKESEEDYKNALLYGEPCESSLFSSYINCKGFFYPCSFSESGEGLNVLECIDFIKDIWFNKKTNDFRRKLLKSSTSCNSLCKSKKYCRSCPVYSGVSICKKEENYEN